MSTRKYANPTGILMSSVTAGNQAGKAHFGMATALLVTPNEGEPPIHCIIITNTMGDLKRMAKHCGEAEFVAERVASVALMPANQVTLEDDEL